jgi:hypothetical protein
MRKYFPIIIGFFLLNIIFSVSCYFDDGKGGAAPVPTSVSFKTDVIPLLTKDCATTGCHAGASPAGNLNLNVAESDDATVHTAVLTEVTLATPDASKLLQKASASVTHGGSSSVTWTTSSSEYATVLSWITAGAENN